MEFDELPTHIQEKWEQSEQFGDELRMIRTLRAGKHGEVSWPMDKIQFAADAKEKIERHRKGFFHPHEAAAEISRLKPFEEAAERELLTKIVHHIKEGAIPIYREPLMFRETFTTGDKYSELEILLNASDLNEWLKSRNTDLQLMVPKQSAVTNLQLTAVQSLSTPQPKPASEQVTPAAELAAKGVTTAHIVEAFAGLVVFKLGKAMTDRAVWTSDARITSGTKGGKYKSLWNPVIMATALQEREKVPMSKLNHAFNTCKFLADWREEWNRLSKI